MFKKILVSLIATMFIGSVVMAAPAPKTRATIDRYAGELAEKTGKSEEEIKKDMIEALRTEGKYSEADLKRIGREKVDLDPVKQKEMVNLLKSSERFQTKMGLVAVRNDAINKEAGDAFDAMKTKDAPVVDAKSETKAVKAPKTELSQMEIEALALKDVQKVLGTRAREALMSVADEHYPLMRQVTMELKRKVAKGEMDRAKAESLIVDAAASPKALEGKIVLGKGASKACMAMAREALENFAEFVHGGAVKGTDPESYVRGMGEAAAEHFTKKSADKLTQEEIDENIARVCALRGCGLVSEIIQKTCDKMGAAHAI